MNRAVDCLDAEAACEIEMRLRPLAPRHRIAHLEALIRRAAPCSRRQRLLRSLLSDETGPQLRGGGRA